MHKSIKIGKLLVIPYDSFSNYVMLPPNILEKISKIKNHNFTYHFELKSSYNTVFYVGVKEFTAPDNCIIIPSWLAEQFGEDYLMVTLLKDITKGDYVKIQPQERNFFDLPEADKILESGLSEYISLHIDQIIPVKLLDEIYKIKIIEIKSLDTDITHELVDITNIDLKVDIDNIFEPTNILNNEFNNMVKINEEPIISDFQMTKENLRLARLKYYDKKNII